MARLALLTFLLATAVTFSCANARPEAGAEKGEYQTKDSSTQFRLETVASGLEVPWALAWLPDGSLLFTERPGRVRIVENGKLRAEPVLTVPDVEPTGESGLMDISLHPNFAANQFIYMTYAYNDDGKHIKVVRYKYAAGKFTEPKVILDGVPGSPNHAGSRARFGPDGKLYFATGDSTDWELAQNNMSLAGKILRLNDDGSIPKDNPFVARDGYRPEIYATGNRNPQGLAWQPGSGLLFETEHGPSTFEGRGGGGDEVNIIESGKNYGWPVIHHKMTREGLESPLLEYTPACAPGSAMFYSGDIFPAFKNNFFFGCLKSARIVRLVLDGRKVVSQEDLLTDKLGRVRAMEQGPDGYIYFTTSNRDGRGTPANDDDRIMRMVPIAKDAKK